jgi:hypothetical protein
VADLRPTPASIIRNLLQELEGALAIQRNWRTHVRVPRFFLEAWVRQCREVLALLERAADE